MALLDGSLTQGPWPHSTDPAELERIRQFRQYIWHVWQQVLPIQDAEIAAGLSEADLDPRRSELDD